MATNKFMPEGRDFVINIYRDLTMSFSRNSMLRPYSEIIVAQLDTYLRGNDTDKGCYDFFERLSQTTDTDESIVRLSKRAMMYIKDEQQHIDFLESTLPF
jgi:hypothetical protein